MITFKQSARKRNIRRDRDDDLSIVTGGRPIIRFGNRPGPSHPPKRVRTNDAKLKRDFVDARALAYFRKGERPPGPFGLPTPAPSSFIQYATERSAVPNKNDPTSLLTFPVPPCSNLQCSDELQGPCPQNGRYTINSVPSLLKTSQSRQAVLNSQPQSILKPITNNPVYGHGASPYWTAHINTGGGRGQKRKLASTVYNMSCKSSGKKASTWKICSSMPMTRTDASWVQMEMASTMCSVENGVSSAGSFPSTPRTSQGILSHNGMLPPRHAVPSLIKSVVPPPSPLFPISPNVPSAFNPVLNFNGVHQSEWVDRSKCVNRAPTKQYSMEQIIDILCGFATPDSIMANQLFQPFPSMPVSNSMNQPEPQAFTTTVAPTTNNGLKSYNNFTGTCNNNNNCETRADDGETSIYFQTTSNKGKSVSFLTDNKDNICVTKHIFDPFSQQMSRMTKEASPVFNKENADPNIFANVLPFPPQPLEKTSIFSTSPVPSFLNTSTLPELKGSLFSQLSNSGNNNSSSFITSPAAPLFELEGSNTVGLVGSSISTPSGSANCSNGETAQRQSQNSLLPFPYIQSPLSDIVSQFDFRKIDEANDPISPSDFKKIHPSWENFLQDLGSGSSSM